MLAVGVGETVTDGKTVYVLDRDFKYRRIKVTDRVYPASADHKVSTEVLKMMVSIQ